MANKEYEEVLSRARNTEPPANYLNSFEYHVLQKSILDLGDRLHRLERLGEKSVQETEVKGEESFLFKVGDRVRITDTNGVHIVKESLGADEADREEYPLTVWGKLFTREGKFYGSDKVTLSLVKRPEVKGEEAPFKVGDIGYFIGRGRTVVYGALLEVINLPHEEKTPTFVHSEGLHTRYFSLTPPQLDEQNRAIFNG